MLDFQLPLRSVWKVASSTGPSFLHLGKVGGQGLTIQLQSCPKLGTCPLQIQLFPKLRLPEKLARVLAAI
jgi:hypothetical protein